MTHQQKLNHIKARLREIVEDNRYKSHGYVVFNTLAAENWIEMIEDLEKLTALGDRERHKAVSDVAENALLKTISRWESVYGTITEEETR